MVKKIDRNGAAWHEPPYSSEEEQQLDKRIYAEPISVVVGNRQSTEAGQRNRQIRAHALHWRIDPEHQAMMDLGEAIRGYIDAQNVSSWYKNFAFDAVEGTGSFFIPLDRPLNPDEVSAIQRVGRAHGMLDLADNGRGITMTTFGDELEEHTLSNAIRDGLVSEIRRVVSDAGEPYRIHTESGCHNYGPLWHEGEGSGAATHYLLGQIEHVGERLRESFDRNSYLSQAAIARMERDEEWAIKFGRPRPDIQNARRIIGMGVPWMARLQNALDRGEALP